MLQLQLNGAAIALVEEGVTCKLPDGDFVSPTAVGAVHGKDYVFVEYVPPTPPPPTIEEIRAAMPDLSPRQIRLALNSISITDTNVESALSGNADGLIEWKYATKFKRTHPLIAQLIPTFSLTEDQVDSLWMNAVDL